MKRTRPGHNIGDGGGKNYVCGGGGGVGGGALLAPRDVRGWAGRREKRKNKIHIGKKRGRSKLCKKRAKDLRRHAGSRMGVKETEEK